MIFKRNYTKYTDEDLMLKSANGDTRAFTCLYDRYGKKMHSYFYRMLWNDTEKSEDFTQDLFSKIIEKPHLYKEGKKFSSWLYSIAANMCKNEYRSADVRRRAASEMEYLSNNSHEIETKTDANYFKKDLDSAINNLNADQRAVFIMKYKQGLKIKDISESLDCSEGTVKSRLFYALKKLSAELESYNPKSAL